MREKRIAVYPGTFDPVTNGHLDIIRRGARLCDHLILGVAINRGKGPLFVIEVKPFENLLINFAHTQGASMIVRGLRAVSDFEYEFQMAGMNSHLDGEIETVFLMASDKCQFISSRFVKEIGKLDGDIQGFVTPNVREKLLEKFAD